MAKDVVPSASIAADDLRGRLPASNDCWNRIGVSGDGSCPELAAFIHCRNCPVFAAAARSFFDRPVPAGYLADWSGWLGDSSCLASSGDEEGEEGDDLSPRGDRVSVLIFRLGREWLAFRTCFVAQVTALRPVHRVPHRSNQVFAGLVTLNGQVELCVSLYGLLSVEAPASPTRLVVLRDRDRGETWACAVDEALGVRHILRSRYRTVPATLVNPAVGFSQAVLSWNGLSIGLLDEERVFSALGSLGT